ncbi:tyrosine-type recombinase/integrase [Serratia symbiotica]|uniref:Tyrosine-type recombinase/integrase n=1 Tax=Serratia symbiotica TaxID=138074 RepID=A0A068Z3C8_9GAMM
MGLRDKRRATVLQTGRGPHGGLAYWMVQYLAWLHEHNQHNLRGHKHQLGRFLSCSKERELEQAQSITLPILEQHQRQLYHQRKPNGDPLSVSTQCNHLNTLKAFLSWLTHRHWLLSNPAADLERPKQGERLPKDVLSVVEVAQLLAWPDINTVKGLRDRAMLEVLYSTGMRRAELARLRLHSINHAQGTVMIHPPGKRTKRSVDSDRRTGL